MSWTVPGYTEVRELGSGAAGRVVLATHDETGVPVAIKYLSQELAGDPDFLAGFRNEARLLGQVDSPHVARLYEYVEQQPHAAIVMELVDGVSLRALLREQGPTEPEAALVVLKGSLLGLAAAHAYGVVHRDYKPENVMVAGDGGSKLVDFGVAVRAGAEAPVSGTPSYMAPEQWAGGNATPCTDVYAATATFYECLTGAPPFPGGDLDALRRQHTHAAVPVDAVPDAVRGLVRTGLAKEAQRRPADASAFAAELEGVASAAYGEDWEERGRGQLARRASLLLFLFPLAGLDGGGTAIATSWLTRGRVVAAAVVVTVLAGGGYAAARISGSPTGATARHGAASFSYSARPSGPAPSPASPPGSSSLPRPHPSSSAGSTSSGAPPSPATRTPTPTETATTTSHHVPPPPHTSTTVKPPAQQVHVVITSFAGAATAESVLHVHVDTTTTAPVTLTIRYFGGKTKSTPGAQDGATVTIPLSGATSYDSGDKHVWTVDGTGCPPDVWFVQVTSTPAAGNGTQQTYTGAPICP